MGRLIDGRWSNEWYDTKSTGGRFVREDSAFRDHVRADGSTRFAPEPGRYHLYVSLACPGAHRTLIARNDLTDGMIYMLGERHEIPDDPQGAGSGALLEEGRESRVRQPGRRLQAGIFCGGEKVLYYLGVLFLLQAAQVAGHHGPGDARHAGLQLRIDGGEHRAAQTVVTADDDLVGNIR